MVGEPRPGLDLILYGVILVLALGFQPRGLVGLWSDLWHKAGRR
jgi:ABC-type branched-subunit amino acid transport system permease subunit